jgi:hypothetical protein
MNFYKWLTVIGGVLTLFGILTAFMSSKYTESLMGEARKGVAVWAPDSSSPEWKEKERLLWWADFWFLRWLGSHNSRRDTTNVGGYLAFTRLIIPPCPSLAFRLCTAPER